MKIFVRRGIKPDMDVVGERKKLSKFDRFAAPIPEHINPQEQNHNEFTLTYLNNSNKNSELVILYIHGGGFMWEMKTLYTSFIAEFCNDLNAEAYLPWYRLAPEHPYPAGPEDCFNAYKALLDKGIKAKDIVIAGDSAGGNLALTTLLRIRDAKLEMPCGAILLSPVTDLAEQSSSWILNGWRGKDPLFPKDAFSLMQHYCTDSIRTDPLMSPYYADYQGFPPMMFIVGHTESLLEDSISPAKKARAAKVPVQVQVWRGMPHVFPIIGFLPEATKVKKELKMFFQACHKQNRHYIADDSPLIVLR
jgi:epsilon-lactone hydrolase